MSTSASDLRVESHDALPLLNCPKPVLSCSAWLLCSLLFECFPFCFCLLVVLCSFSHFVILIAAFLSASPFSCRWYRCSSHESRTNKNSSKCLTCYSMNQVFYTDLSLCFSLFPLSPVFSSCIRCSSNTSRLALFSLRSCQCCFGWQDSHRVMHDSESFLKAQIHIFSHTYKGNNMLCKYSSTSFLLCFVGRYWDIAKLY